MHTANASIAPSAASSAVPACGDGPREGSVLRIALGGGASAFARVLPDSRVAIYEPQPDGAAPSEVCGSAILWKLPVTAAALGSGRWPVVGHLPLEPELAAPVQYFAWNRLTGQFDPAGGATGAAGSAGWQQRRVWGAAHIEERIRDYLAGRVEAGREQLESVW
jgi:hypothetical protein